MSANKKPKDPKVVEAKAQVEQVLEQSNENLRNKEALEWLCSDCPAFNGEEME